MLETVFPQIFGRALLFCGTGVVALVCRMLVETNPKDPYQLGISVREFVYRKLRNVESFCTLEVGKVRRFVMPISWMTPNKMMRSQQVPIILGGFNLKVRDVLRRMFGGKTL